MPGAKIGTGETSEQPQLLGDAVFPYHDPITTPVTARPHDPATRFHFCASCATSLLQRRSATRPCKHGSSVWAGSPLSMSLALSPCDGASLAKCEKIIAHGLRNFVEVGLALTAIRDGRLYKASHKTFEDYCKERWGMNKRYGNRLIESAIVVRNLGPTGPKNERSARPLAALPPEAQAEAWTEATQNSPTPTAAEVEQAVETVRARSGVSASAQRAADEAAKDSAKLWTLKNAWKAAGKKDRKRFLEWIK